MLFARFRVECNNVRIISLDDDVVKCVRDGIQRTTEKFGKKKHSFTFLTRAFSQTL